MKFKELKESFETMFSWDKKERKENRSEIDDVMKKLLEKRNDFEAKLKKEEDKLKKEEIKQKIKALEKLIKKAKKNLY